MSSPNRDNADIAFVVTSIGATAVLSLLYNAVAGRWLGPALYSDFVGTTALAALLSVSLGAFTPITAHLSAAYAAAGRPAKIRGLVERILRPVVIVGIAASILSIVVAVPLARALQFSSALTIPVAVLVFLGISIASVVRAALRGSQRYGSYGWSMVAEAAVRLLVGTACLLLFKSLVPAILAYAIGTFAIVPSALRIIRRMSDSVDPVERGEITSMLGATTVLVGAMALYLNIDLIVVKRLFEPAEAGIYGAAAALARTMAVIALPLEALLVPRLTYLLGRNERVGGHVGRLALVSMSIAAIPLIAFALVPGPIVSAVYGMTFAAAAPLLLPLGASVFFAYLAYLTGQALISLGRQKAVYPFAAVVLLEVALLVMIPRTLATVVIILLCTRASLLVMMLLAILATRKAG